eukprot:jgi/Astpho2/5616/Aster-02868
MCARHFGPAAYFFDDMQDRRRIKQMGPSMEDVTLTYNEPYMDPETEETTIEEKAYVPQEVLGNVSMGPEPDWLHLPQMPFMEFYHGLRQRNWTSEYYQQDAEPWTVQMYEDSGRTLLPNWPGWRAVVTDSQGQQQWVNMPTEGQQTFLKDFMAGGTA